jgi:hypothetical protein
MGPAVRASNPQAGSMVEEALCMSTGVDARHIFALTFDTGEGN